MPFPAALAALAALGFGCGGNRPDLLRGAQPIAARGVSNAARITDGVAASEGDEWNGPTAAVLDSPAAFVEYDLGQTLPIREVIVQGDDNDDYVVSGSTDQRQFHEIWVAPPAVGGGLRERVSPPLDDQARWVRLSARGGDGHYSVSLLELASQRGGWLSGGTRVPAEGRPAQVRTRLLLLLFAFALLLFGCGAGSSRRRVALLALAPIVAFLAFVASAAEAWPLGGTEVSFARLTAAAIALLALGRAALWATTRPARRSAVVAGAVAAATLSFACFYNLGHPEFWNDARRRPLFVHLLDMRIYQPFAKYYDELRYDGVYAASILAYAENHRGGSLASLSSLEIRDLRDHRMRRVGDLTDAIREVRQRFSDDRWQDFKQDMRFFEDATGPSYLPTMNDHGANAPPVWVFFARLMLGRAQATEATLTAAGLVDTVFFLAMAGALWACFGLLPMAAAMTVFGATDLYMFGTNWAGATLRHDWIALLAFAACALKTKRWTLAGVMIGLAGMIRAFPAVALVGVVFPAVLWTVERWRRQGRPTLRQVIDAHPEIVRVVVGAAVTVVIAFLVTGALYSFQAWAQWWHKVGMLNEGIAINEVSLRVLVGGTDENAGDLLRARWPIYLAVELGAVALFVAAARGRPLHQSMLLSLPLAFVFMHPVNYHAHMIFLLALVGAEGALWATAAPLLAMCVANYWAALDTDMVRHFQLMTAMMYTALAWLFVKAATHGTKEGVPR